MKLNVKGIMTRWLINCFGLIVIFLFAIGILASFIIKIFFYDHLQPGIFWNVHYANKAVLFLMIVFLGAGFFIALLVGITNYYFIKSIVDPVQQVGNIANRIAQGDLNIKIQKLHNDEIGELCDAINYMASELRNSEKMKNDFISSVSHELRTPLTAIKGWAETINSEKPDMEINQKGVQVIISESERLCGIVEELLDFSSIQNDRMTVMMDMIDILAELGEAVFMLQNRANTEQKHLLYAEPHVLSPVLGDKNRLRQVFINVIDNALKYTSEGGIVNVSTQEQDGFIKVIINDNGCGIKAEHLPKVKEKFYKGDQTKIGAGIGLAIADGIIKIHGGQLDIVSEENVGTTVTITIPVIDTK